MNEQLAQRLGECTALPSMPAIALEVLELAQKDDSNISEIAKVISRDPALSSKILRTVNSSYYGRSQTVATISHALVILGLQAVKTLVLGFSLVNSLSKHKGKGFKHAAYWRRSVCAAAAARMLAGQVAKPQAEECFLAALLMDIGMLVLAQMFGEEYATLTDACASHSELAAAEQAKLQMTHADVAAVLADRWRLPPILSAPMGRHHQAEAEADPQLQGFVRIAAIASRCADVFVDAQPAAAIADVRAACAAAYQMSEADADRVLAEVGKHTREVAALFEVELPTGNYDAILKQANEALVELTLNSQQRAQQLDVQNRQLQVDATTDALTGLANRATFDRVFAARLRAAAEKHEPLTLLMLDIDHFKAVNDQHGHPGGDAVLREVGRRLAAMARPDDLVARYGGEEIALVLPRTPRAAATVIAEAVRRAIAARPVLAGAAEVRVTASVGSATFEEGCPLREPAHLLKAADLSVYAAKHAGRNCVRVFSPKPAAKTPAA